MKENINKKSGSNWRGKSKINYCFIEKRQLSIKAFKSK